MTIENIFNVVSEFTNRLQLPESKYSFITTSNSDIVEFILLVENKIKLSLQINNGNINVLYTNDYNANKYSNLEFQTPITLLYQLCVIFFANTKEVIQIDFNELLSVILMETIHDWKTLIFALSENLNLKAEIQNSSVNVEGVEIHYSGFENKIKIDNTEIVLENMDYISVVEAMFKCMEYIANIMDIADTLFQVVPEEEEIDEVDNVSEEGDGGDTNIDIDMEIPDNQSSEPAPVEPMENETFEEPQDAVVTMDDLL